MEQRLKANAAIQLIMGNLRGDIINNLDKKTMKNSILRKWTGKTDRSGV